jgi:GNAT superfamily N-acetyltransferase
MPLSIALIPADFDHWDDVLALIMRAFAFMDGVIDPPSSAHLLTVDTLRDKARRETGFVALNDHKIVGCVFALERADDLYVGKLAVAPDCQGQGIGRRLMLAVEILALDRGNRRWNSRRGSSSPQIVPPLPGSASARPNGRRMKATPDRPLSPCARLFRKLWITFGKRRVRF